ncbi:MAG: hypothetical protein ACAH80_06595 [Alphaproteobacteria bacterium]
MAKDNPMGGSNAPGKEGNGNKRGMHTLIFELETMQGEFNKQAEHYTRMTNTVGEALTIVRETQRQLNAAQAERDAQMLGQRAALLGGAISTAAKKGEFVFLTDGSLSMRMGQFDAVLDTVALARKGSGLVNAAPPALGLFGSALQWVTDDITDAAARKKIAETLRYDARLLPAVAEMEKLAAVNTLNKKATHFIIFSGGDLQADADKSKAALEKLMTANKKVTLDIVVVSPASAKSARDLAAALAASFPGRAQSHLVVLEKPTYTVADRVTLSVKLQADVMDMMLQRVQSGAPKRKSAPKP